jgi:hypothetical protein
MPSDHLADPPMIITDIPTNEKYGIPYTYYTTDNSNHAVYVDGDFTDKYFGGLDNEPGSVMDVCLIPNGIQDSKLRHGVIAVVRTYEQGTSFGGLIYSKVMMHRGGTKLSDYATGWVEVPGTRIGTGTGNFGFIVINSNCFSQRQGEYGYAVMQINQDYGSYNIGYKFSRSEFTQVWYQESFYLADFGPIFDFSDAADWFVSDDADPFLWHIWGGSHRRLNNGDDTAQGTQVMGFVDDGTPLGSYIYRGDNTGQDPYSSSYGIYLSPGTGFHFTGKTGAFRQKYAIPAGQWGHGPFFVHPWESGSYDPPELWFFIQEYDHRGFVTGRYKIYRSKWKRGVYKRYDNPRPEAPLNFQPVIFDPNSPTATSPPPGGAAAYNFHSDGRNRTFEELPVTLDDDPAYNLGPHQSGGTRFPKLNPFGYGFDHNWFTQANYVGTVGPFSNLRMFNPKGTAAATEQNRSYGIGTNGYYNNYNSIIDFKVMRDRKRRGLLHLLAQDDGGNLYSSDSSNDGRTWSRGQQSEGPHGFYGAHPEVFSYSQASGQLLPNVIRAERLFDDATICAINYSVSGPNTAQVRQARLNIDRYASGQRAAFLVADYINTGVGNGNETGAVFKRGELNRQSWV